MGMSIATSLSQVMQKLKLFKVGGLGLFVKTALQVVLRVEVRVPIMGGLLDGDTPKVRE